DYRGQVSNPGAGKLGNKYLPAVHPVQAVDHKPYPLLQSNPKPCHPGIGNRYLTGFSLLQEQGDYTASASNYISIPDNAKTCILRTHIRFGGDKKLVRAKFSCSIQINWIGRFIRTQGDDSF